MTDKKMWPGKTEIERLQNENKFLNRRVCKDDSLLVKNDQLRAKNKEQAAWLEVQQKELDSTRDFEVKVLGQIEQLEELLKQTECPNRFCRNGTIIAPRAAPYVCKWCEAKKQCL